MISFAVDKKLEEKGKTKYWLEKQTGLAFVTVDKIVSNDSVGIMLNTLDKICEALNCDIADILVRNERRRLNE